MSILPYSHLPMCPLQSHDTYINQRDQCLRIINQLVRSVRLISLGYFGVIRLEGRSGPSLLTLLNSKAELLEIRQQMPFHGEESVTGKHRQQHPPLDVDALRCPPKLLTVKSNTRWVKKERVKTESTYSLEAVDTLEDLSRKMTRTAKLAQRMKG